jgi:hypothetical protein
MTEEKLKEITSTTNLLSIRQLALKHSAFSESALRWHIHMADSNGLRPAIIRVGRKILIREKAFLVWIEENKGGVKS